MSNVTLRDAYANNLQQRFGYPLRRPNPSSKEGLQIGDVGYVDESGAFHVLCNIRCPSRSDGFEAIPLDKNLICKNATAIIPKHSIFTGVNQDNISQESKSGIYNFTATAEKGAILILPSGAKLCDLQDQQKLNEFRDLAIKHARRWCLSAGPGHDSLYLITGLYQTSSWTLASFYGRQKAVDGKKILVQESAEQDDIVAYTWRPEFPNLDPQSCLKRNNFENQTVLIKGFKMQVRPILRVALLGPAQESRNCFAPLLEYIKYLASRFGVIIPSIGVEPYPHLSRQPHYLDVVNNYLLEENSDADVVITHDDLWIKMMEKSGSVVMQESELLEHVKGEYIPRSGNNAIWLQRPLEDPNGALAQETVSSESRVVITHICAENVPVGLEYVPVGFFVRVEIDGGISRLTENKPAPVDDHNIQWNDQIYLPSASSTKVRLVLCASFEFSPVLGHGEDLGTINTCVSDLLEQTGPFMIKESLVLVSVQQWYGNCCISSCADDSVWKERSAFPDIANLTDEGHRALLGYYKNHNEKELDSSVALFTQALEKCPQDDPCHVVAMFNLAKAEFLSDQFHHTHQNFHHSTSLFKEALRLRAGDHPDRPMTLLYLSQALLYYRALGFQEPQSTLHEYIKELETICPRDTHTHHAADLVMQAYELTRLQTSDDFGKLNELISKWVRAADELPEAYFDKPIRFDNIGLALQRRFQLYHDTADLKRAVEWFAKAVQITPEGHAQKSTYTDHLSDVLYQWTTVVLTSSSVNEASDAAAKLGVPKSHVYQAICEVLEGSDRVLEAIKCFRKMQGELFKMHIPSERATWEIAFRRRCGKKFEEQGDTLMESRKPNAAIESYSIALSLDPTNISDIIVKCCKAGLLRLINVNKFHVYWTRCNDLEGSGCVLEAIACFRKMQDELVETSVPDDRAAWEPDFRRRCVDKADKKGTGAMVSKDHNSAIGYYSCALSLDPTNVNIIVKCCKARVGLLEDERDPSMIEYKRKHAVLHSLGCYAEAFKAFETMLSRMENSHDPRVRDMRNQYIDATSDIRNIIEQTIRDIPYVLIDTATGRLYDKTMQAAAFEDLPIFDELRSFMTTRDRLDHARIKREVEKFYEYVMFSHKWQEDEPTFQMVKDALICGLPASPANDKLVNFCKLVQSRRFQWAWSDTCCIDQSDKGVQQDSVIAMYRWYCRAALTIVHLLGVHSKSQQKGSLRWSIWNMRGWTYQEYFASKVLQFYTEDWQPYLDLEIFNHKESSIILEEMEQATNFATEALAMLQPGLTRVREKLYLASKRQTTREEDIAYSLFGIFNAALPIIYGEGNQAVGRLLEHILTRSDSVTILAWTGISGNNHSYLPSDLTVYNQVVPPHLPQPVETAEMDRMVMDVRSCFPDPSPIVTLYEQLHNLPSSMLVADRLQLRGLVFPLDNLKHLSECDSNTIHPVYHATTPALGDVRIETKDELAGMKGLVLIHPWINPLIDEDFNGNTPQFDLVTRSLRLLVRLRQPFGALLLASQGRGQYQRVATDSFIKAQVPSEMPLEKLMQSIRTVEVQ